MGMTYLAITQQGSKSAMSSPALTGPEIAPKSGTVKHVVIFLHGVGSNGDDLIELGHMVQDALPDTQFLSPNGAQPFDQAPFGYQWFSLRERSQEKMLAGAREAAPVVNRYIDEVKARFGVNDRQIALVGFSQGTMMALYAGLRRESALAAIVGFSGAMLGGEELAKNDTPVCLIHGEYDEVVPYAALAHAKMHLEKASIAVETHARPNLGHSIDGPGLETMVKFLRTHLGVQ